MLFSTFTLFVVLYPESMPPDVEFEYSYLAVLKVRRPDVGLTDRSRMIFVELLGDVKYWTSRSRLLLLIVEKLEAELWPRELPGRDTDC